MTEDARRAAARLATDAAICSVGSELGRVSSAPAPTSPPNSFHRPMIMDLDWETVAVKKLREGQIISVYGKELVVSHVGPAARGGDFYLLEAHDTVSPLTGPSSVVSLELDKNTDLLAREDTP